MSMKTETIIVEGMSCNHCRQAVEKAVRALPGVIAAEVDLAAKTLRVEFDGAAVSLTDIRAAVDDAGFTAVVSA